MHLSGLLIDVADVLRRGGRLNEALEQYRQALNLAEVAERLDPNNAQAQERLSVSHYRIGECLMKLNDTAGAFDHLHRAAALREALAARPGASVAARLDPAFAYAHLSELYAALAVNENTPRAARIKHWQSAREWHAKSLAIFLIVREEGLLPAKHAASPDEIAREIAKCDEALAKLQAPAMVASPQVQPPPLKP
jgi:tetratricopeptide (TPR) repeat protein